jgi:hypothetical protein
MLRLTLNARSGAGHGLSLGLLGLGLWGAVPQQEPAASVIVQGDTLADPVRHAGWVPQE